MLSIIIHRFKQTNGSISAFSEIRKYEFDYKAFILVTFDGPRWHVILDKEILLTVKKKNANYNSQGLLLNFKCIANRNIQCAVQCITQHNYTKINAEHINKILIDKS